jgi:hypothetical protein
MMLTKIDEIYDLCIQFLPPSDRVQLATLLLNNFVQEGSTVIDESDTWTEEDIADLSTFSLQYAATIYPDDDELI